MRTNVFGWVVRLGLCLSLVACSDNGNLVAAVEEGAGTAGAGGAAPTSNTNNGGGTAQAGGSAGGVHAAAGASAGGAAERELTVLPEHRACTAGDTCISAMVRCSCDCGTPINMAYWDLYLDAYDVMCENYDGPWCGMQCDAPVQCLDGVCAVPQVSDPAP